MRKREDMFINYQKSYRKRGRKTKGILLGASMALVVLGVFIFFAVNAIGKADNDISRSDINNKDEANNDITSNNNASSQSDNIQPSGSDLVDNSTGLINQSSTDCSADDNTPKVNDSDEITQTSLGPSSIINPTKEPVEVKGLYVTAHSAASKKMNDIIELFNKTEINAVVIDVKYDHGKITYAMRRGAY